MAVFIERVDILNNRNHLKRFINVQHKIYKKDKHWVPHLRSQQMNFFRADHPFFKTNPTSFYIAILDGVDVGRIMAVENRSSNSYHNKKEGHWGFLEAINDNNVFKSLFNAANEWSRSIGLDSMLGPFNPSVNYEAGMLFEGFKESPIFMMNYNPDYYIKHVESLGFNKVKDLYAYSYATDTHLPKKITQIAKRVEDKDNISYRCAIKENWESEVSKIYSIYNDAWSENWGNSPMSKEEFSELALGLKEVIDEDLVLFSMINNEEVGFILTVPDFNQVFRRIRSGRLFPFGFIKLLRSSKYITKVRVLAMGVMKKYRNLGLETLLYKHTHETIQNKKQYEYAEMSWILEDNNNMNRPLIEMKAIPYRKYRIYQKEL